MKQRILIAVALVALGVSAASAQQPAKSSTAAKPKAAATHMKPAKHVTSARAARTVALTESQPGLIKQATVSREDALKTAEGSVKGTVVSERLEKVGNDVVYRFGIRSNGRLQHVFVNAKTNAIVKLQAHKGARKHTGKA